MQQTSLPRHGHDDLAEFRARMEQLARELPAPLPSSGYVAHTDGACLSNPDGPGGWGAVVETVGQRWELWGHLSSTSNNRAEILAVLAALEWVPPNSSLLVRSDSQYTLNVLTGQWKAKLNLDLWSLVRETVAQRRLRVETEWVRGHAGDAGNERADELSVLGAVRGDVERLRRLRSARAGGANLASPSGGPAPGRSIGPAGRAGDARAASPLQGLRPRGAWEKTFLASVEKQLRAGRALSEKQQAVVDRIRARSDGSGE